MYAGDQLRALTEHMIYIGLQFIQMFKEMEREKHYCSSLKIARAMKERG